LGRSTASRDTRLADVSLLLSAPVAVRPTTDEFDDVVLETIDLATRDGVGTTALLSRPSADGVFPAVAVGAEGTGLNTYIRHLAATLSHLGFVVIVPDYYRGSGPPEPDNYDDFDTLMSFIEALDFRRAVHDLLDAIDYVQALPYVDAARVASWGYCTGGTLALFAACLRQDLGASVVFFPSQPTFPEHDDQKPVDVVDLMWNVACPLLVLIGDQDVVLPPDRLEHLRRRWDRWGIDLTVKVYPGGGHAFNAHGSTLYHQESDEHAWDDAIAFLSDTLHERT
jgi:carboxymethylenebutenolidase